MAPRLRGIRWGSSISGNVELTWWKQTYPQKQRNIKEKSQSRNPWKIGQLQTITKTPKRTNSHMIPNILLSIEKYTKNI